MSTDTTFNNNFTKFAERSIVPPTTNSKMRSHPALIQPPNSVFFRNLSFFCQEEHLARLIQSVELSAVRIVLPDSEFADGRKLFYAFVEMSSKESCQELIQKLNDTWFMGRKLRLYLCDEWNPRTDKDSIPNGIEVHVRFESVHEEDHARVTEEKLCCLISSFGEIVDAIIRRHTMISPYRQKGYGFVFFNTVESAANAVSSWDQHTVDNIKYRVQLSYEAMESLKLLENLSVEMIGSRSKNEDPVPVSSRFIPDNSMQNTCGSSSQYAMAHDMHSYRTFPQVNVYASSQRSFQPSQQFRSAEMNSSNLHSSQFPNYFLGRNYFTAQPHPQYIYIHNMQHQGHNLVSTNYCVVPAISPDMYYAGMLSSPRPNVSSDYHANLALPQSATSANYIPSPFLNYQSSQMCFGEPSNSLASVHLVPGMISFANNGHFHENHISSEHKKRK